MLLKLTARGIECFQVELEGRDRWTEDDRARECPTWVCWNLESIVFRWLISSWNSCWIDCFSLSVCDWRWRKRESWLSNCSIDDASDTGLLLRGLTSLTALLRATISASCDERIVRLWSIYSKKNQSLDPIKSKVHIRSYISFSALEMFFQSMLRRLKAKFFNNRKEESIDAFPSKHSHERHWDPLQVWTLVHVMHCSAFWPCPFLSREIRFVLTLVWIQIYADRHLFLVSSLLPSI